MPHVSKRVDSRTAPQAERLAAALMRKGMSQSELARRLGTNRRTVGRWLNEGTRITAKHHLKALPRILGTPSDYFMSPSRGDRLDRLETDVAEIRTELHELRTLLRRFEDPLPRENAA